MKITITLVMLILGAGPVLAHDVQVDGVGGIIIGCTNGTRAVGHLQGTSVMFEITYADGSQSGMSTEPSGGSPDPAVAIGDGTSLASQVCSQ